MFGFVAAVDLVHAILNRAFHPFTGSWDTAMHCVLFLAPIAYVAVCVWGAFEIARMLAGHEHHSEGSLASVILLLVLSGEIAWASLAPMRTGSSSYRPMFPDFLGGLIVAAATLMAGKSHLHSRVCRTLIVLTGLAWLAGGLTVDLLWWTERTNRGVGPIWRLPLIGPVIEGFSYLFLLAGIPAEMCSTLPQAAFSHSSIVHAVWLAMLAVFFAWGLRRFAARRTWLSSAAVAASCVFLAHKTVEWSSFIAD